MIKRSGRRTLVNRQVDKNAISDSAISETQSIKLTVRSDDDDEANRRLIRHDTLSNSTVHVE